MAPDKIIRRCIERKDAEVRQQHPAKDRDDHAGNPRPDPVLPRPECTSSDGRQQRKDCIAIVRLDQTALHHQKIRKFMTGLEMQTTYGASRVELMQSFGGDLK